MTCGWCEAAWDGENIACPNPRCDEETTEIPFVCPGCYAVGTERCAPGCTENASDDDSDYGGEYDDHEEAWGTDPA